ncbi:endonuclease/exonuclease/phosphatase family protein [Pilimelia columellifera]
MVAWSAGAAARRLGAVALVVVTVAGSQASAGAPPTPAGTDCADYPATRIRAIQGASHRSPLSGQQSTRGVVAAVGRTGLWLQDPCPDRSPATAEGLYVHLGAAPTVAIGDEVTVVGTVAERRPGGANTGNLTLTELTAATVTRLGARALPAPVVVGKGGRVPPAMVIDDDATGSVETSGAFEPTEDGIDFWESLEGMRVQIAGAVAVGPRTARGEIAVVPAGAGLRTPRGGIVARADDFNPERVIIDDRLAPTPTANTGDTFAVDPVGVLDYDFGAFKLLPTTSPTVTDRGLTGEKASAAASGQLAVATFNVENLDPGDPPTRFQRLARTVVEGLAAPDLVILEEVQDDDGPSNTAVVSAGRTVAALTAAISAAGGPRYAFRQVDPVDDADGGEPGGNIRNVFLYRADRGLSFVDRPGGAATVDSGVVAENGRPRLAHSPGRIAPGAAAWAASRKPLVGEFRWNGRTVFVVANHFGSKGGDDPLVGHRQPPVRSSEVKRHQQATIVNGFVRRVLAVDPDAAVVVAGDINDFEFSTTTDLLVAGGALVDLPRTLPAAERYTYVYEGNSQVLDHILLSPWLAARKPAYDIVHVNAEFADQVSDHDPQVVRLAF